MNYQKDKHTGVLRQGQEAVGSEEERNGVEEMIDKGISH